MNEETARSAEKIASGGAFILMRNSMADEPRKTMAKLRAKIAALVERSAEKREELQKIQARMDRLSAEVTEGRAEKGKGRKRGSH